MATQILKYQRVVRRDKSKDAIARYTISWAKKMKAIVYKGGCCQHCQNPNPVVLVFHHEHGKDRSIGNLISRKAGWKKLQKELDRCTLLCENCHRKLHKLLDDQAIRHKYIINRRHRKHINKDLCMILTNCCCDMCGYNECKAALDFHHGQGKKENISKYISEHSWRTIGDMEKEIIEEISRCRVLCSNCHRLIHFNHKRFEKFKDQILTKSQNLIEKNRVNAELVVSLAKQGLSRKEIAQQLRCSYERVYEITRANGLGPTYR